MCTTLWLDCTRYTIPNWLVGSLLVLYPVAVYLSPEAVDWKMAMVAMLLVFAVGYIIFSLRVMGGGDVKLITVLALWVGWGMPLMEFHDHVWFDWRCVHAVLAGRTKSGAVSAMEKTFGDTARISKRCARAVWRCDWARLCVDDVYG